MVNLNLFMESQFFNTYFNKKLYVSGNGIIKNAPECDNEFGSIIEYNNKELIEIVASNQFQKYWKIDKSKIDECKNCIYRYMCIDNRIPIDTKNKTYKFNTICELKQ